MNSQLKDKLSDKANCIGRLLTGFITSFVSVLRMAVLSRIAVAHKSKSYQSLRLNDDFTLLANGPSLKAAIESGELITKEVDLACVNSFCESNYFQTLKPRYYFLIDGLFFHPTNERSQSQVKKMKECFAKVDWQMYLVIPAWASSGALLESVKQNPCIEVLRFNSTTMEGYTWFKQLMYKWHLGMPRCINVTIFAIMSAILMHYKRINLYGVDHTFTQQLFVNDDNILCSMEKHVYNAEGKVTLLPEFTMGEFLFNVAQMFQTHQQLAQLSQMFGCEIINCTRGSFIDAYKRMKY